MAKKIVNISFTESVSLTLTDTFEEFLIYKRAQGNCAETERQYRYHFSKFMKLCRDTFDMINIKQALLQFFSRLSNKSNVTYNMPYKYLNCFFSWCVKNNRLTSNPIKDLELKKKKENSRAIDVKNDIVVGLLDSFDLKAYSGFRNYVIILITLDIGIRPNELVNIERKDINFKSKEITIRELVSKTHEERTLPISDIIVELLQKLLSVTPKEWNQKYVFYTVEGNPLTSDRWSHIIYKHCKKTEIKITAYGLRHIFAINFLRNKGNIFALQRLLGHTDLVMTKKYIALSQVDIEIEHTLASPVNNYIKRNTRLMRI